MRTASQYERWNEIIEQKSIIRLVALGIILFLGTGLAGGIQLYRQNLKVYSDAARSYASMLRYQVEQDNIDQIAARHEDLGKLQEKLRSYMAGGDSDSEAYGKILNETEEELVNLFGEWYEIESFVLGFGNICRDIEYAYVVIPTKNDLIYLWDSEYVEGKYYPDIEHDSYSPKEKEHLMAVMRGNGGGDFFTENVRGELVGTALAPVMDTNGNICAVAAIDISISSIRSACIKMLVNMGIAILVIMLVSIAVYHYVERRQIINPIVTLTKAANGLVGTLRRKGREPVTVNIHTKDEIDVLARSFEEMDSKLLDFIRENDAITAEKERIQTELSLAARIQADMLPSTFPPFPDRKEIDLYARMNPAKEVGGDFYDFFLVGEDCLAVVIADVSGKGIPAALFMMMSKIMIQNFTLTLDSPEEILDRVNDQICNNRTEEMFVTVWLGILNLKTGLLTAVNAGHEYPILKKPDGEFELFKDSHGLVVGGMKGIRYKQYRMQLEPGSRLFLYTDGLPEATDTQNEMFGLQRTLAALNEVKDKALVDVLEHVSRTMTAFVGDAPQFDDTTMLCLDYYGTGC